MAGNCLAASGLHVFGSYSTERGSWGLCRQLELKSEVSEGTTGSGKFGADFLVTQPLECPFSCDLFLKIYFIFV